MKRWLARRFKHVRDLEFQSRRSTYALDCSTATVNVLEDLLRDCQKRQIKFGKITLEEVEILLSATKDYHRCLSQLYAADPIQNRVLPIFEKYNIRVVPNTMVQGSAK